MLNLDNDVIDYQIGHQSPFSNIHWYKFRIERELDFDVLFNITQISYLESHKLYAA